jgi:hypothetical protein
VKTKFHGSVQGLLKINLQFVPMHSPELAMQVGQCKNLHLRLDTKSENQQGFPGSRDIWDLRKLSVLQLLQTVPVLTLSFSGNRSQLHTPAVYVQNFSLPWSFRYNSLNSSSVLLIGPLFIFECVQKMQYQI